MRLGDLDALKQWFEDMSKYYNQFPGTICQTTASNYRTVCEIIDKAPTIDTEPIQQWISVKNRLPNKDENCLAYSSMWNKAIIGHVYSNPEKDGIEYAAINENDFLFDISYWMPIPELPKEK